MRDRHNFQRGRQPGRRHGSPHSPETGSEHRFDPGQEQHEHRHGKRNFWTEWRHERHHHYGIEDFGLALSPKEMEAWREFFHQIFGTWPEEHWIVGGRRFSPWHQGIDAFNPFVATLLSKGGGLLPLYVLHLISQKPRYGNEIMELLAERTNGQWVSNPGAIYPLLTLLEKGGFIEGEWEDPEKRTVRVYTVTPDGQAEVSRIAMLMLPKLTETVQVLQEFIDDLLGESLMHQAETEQPAGDFNTQGDLSENESGSESR